MGDFDERIGLGISFARCEVVPREAGDQRANTGDYEDICDEPYPKFQLKMKKSKQN